MPTDAMTEVEARKAVLQAFNDYKPGSFVDALTRLLLAAERQGYRRGVAEAAKVCEELGKNADHPHYEMAAVEIRERLGGEAA